MKWALQSAPWWQQRSVRERRLITTALVLLVAWALWSAVWKPAWLTLQNAPLQEAQAQAQLRQLEAWQARVNHWRALPDQASGQSRAAAIDISERLGATTRDVGNALRVDMRNWSAATLTQWLQQISQTQAGRVVASELSQGTTGWNGFVTLAFGDPS
jgi:type II secretory pathway component PulM